MDQAAALAAIAQAASALQDAREALTPATAMPQANTYRYQQRHLFQQVADRALAPRLPKQLALLLETTGPDRQHVSKACGWRWGKMGGDYGPETARISANQYPKGSGGWYSIDATGAMAQILAESRHWAFMLRANTARTMAGRKSDTPPVLVVTDSGGVETTYPVWVTCAANATSPSQLVPEHQMPTFVEFVRPDVDPASILAARIEFYVTRHDGVSGAAVFTLHALTPDISEPADVGPLPEGEPLFAHLHTDGRPEADFLYRRPEGEPPHEWNIGAARLYSPDVFDPAAPADASKWPYRGAGLWANPSENVSIVDSGYTGYGFEPLLPGVGAMLVRLPLEDRAFEGSVVANLGTLGCAMELPLPVPLIGRAREIVIDYAMRWGWPDGEVRQLDIDAIKAIWHDLPGDPVLDKPGWLSIGGKTGIVPSHTNKAGGRSGSSGGGGGWQNRLMWGLIPTGLPGPEAVGMAFGFHLFDYFGARHPLGKASAGSKKAWEFGRVGGIVYPNTWVRVRHRLKLNSVDTPEGWAEDGEMTMSIDGKVSWHDTGLCFRSLPLDVESQAHPQGMPLDYDPATSSELYQIGDLGVRALECNVFAGGKAPSAVDLAFAFTDMKVWVL